MEYQQPPPLPPPTPAHTRKTISHETNKWIVCARNKSNRAQCCDCELCASRREHRRVRAKAGVARACDSDTIALARHVRSALYYITNGMVCLAYTHNGYALILGYIKDRSLICTYHLLFGFRLFGQIRYFEGSDRLDDVRQQDAIAKITGQIADALLRFGTFQIVVGPIGVYL